SLVCLGVIILLSAFSGPGVRGGPMPKLADRKLCADQECSRSGRLLWRSGCSPGLFPQ
ncbi:MIA SH3 domain containing, partial [Homo sapiens]